MLSLSHQRLAKSSPRSAGPLPMMPLTCSFIQDFASPSPDRARNNWITTLQLIHAP